MLFSVEQAFVGRDEKRAPLKTPAWEATKKLVRLLILKEVKPFPGSKMIKLLPLDNLFPPPRHSRQNS